MLSFIGHEEHQPFLPSDVALALREAIQQALPRSAAIPTFNGMPISSALAQTLAAASDLKANR
jgi:hypothetical protein